MLEQELPRPWAVLSPRSDFSTAVSQAWSERPIKTAIITVAYVLSWQGNILPLRSMLLALGAVLELTINLTCRWHTHQHPT